MVNIFAYFEYIVMAGAGAKLLPDCADDKARLSFLMAHVAR